MSETFDLGHNFIDFEMPIWRIAIIYLHWTIELIELIEYATTTN